ncbi:MAG: hypothetical protein RMY16_08780 [Nostoc sp. DedQUE12b]|uniref:hypothetical protein n=1 Tax=Nostoc sp. DedQUE12b TaxID=3075398 RepID=UPI002AD58B5A|nr:hypothetical protein [Nostoc sp. DedQUE12b]MDZ8085674.1 hypothetical protein [Nostoc sp. DedQUE12b]
MLRLEDLTKGTQVQGILPNSIVAIVDAQWHGSDVVELTYKDASGTLGNELVFRDREPTLEIITSGGAWSFTADGANFRLASEAHRIRIEYELSDLEAVLYKRVTEYVREEFNRAESQELCDRSPCSPTSSRTQAAQRGTYC